VAVTPSGTVHPLGNSAAAATGGIPAMRAQSCSSIRSTCSDIRSPAKSRPLTSECIITVHALACWHSRDAIPSSSCLRLALSPCCTVYTLW
jgi:hypothetical protein